MKKSVLVPGLFAGFIASFWFILSMITGTKTASMDFENGMIYGYAAMLAGFSMIFVGIKNYRDKYNGGLISFGKAFKIGLFITLISATCYVVTWLIDYYYFIPDFMDVYANHMIEKMKASGAAQTEIDAEIKKMAGYSDMYKNPVLVVLFTYMEIVPVGLLLTLIASLVLKRKVNPDTQNVTV